MTEIEYRAWDGKQMHFWGFRDDGFFGPPLSTGTPFPSPMLMKHMQYTGLKDKKGRKIYKGDILSFDGNITADNTLGFEPNGYIYNEDSKHSVMWDDQQACWSLNFKDDEKWKYKRDTHHLMLDSTAIEVIGNIYENPELMK